MLPLSLVLCGTCILPNISLTHTSIPFHQAAQDLVPPLTAGVTALLHLPSAPVPSTSFAAILPICIGVAIVTHYQSLVSPSPSPNDDAGNDGFLGIAAAFVGVVVCACHAVAAWMLQQRFALDRLQLAFNQAPHGALVLLYIVPWADTFPAWHEVALGTWAMLFMVGEMREELCCGEAVSVLIEIRVALARVPLRFHRSMWKVDACVVFLLGMRLRLWL